MTQSEQQLFSNKPKKAFILGSGFSKDIGKIPTLAKLSKIVRCRYNRDHLEKKFPSYIRDFLEAEVPSLLLDDIEKLLTYLYTSLPWSNLTDLHLRKATFNELAILVGKIIEEEEEKNSDIERDGKSENKPANEQLLIELISYWQENSCPVITFNYDTIIETSAVKNFDSRAKSNFYTYSNGNGQTIHVQIDYSPKFSNQINFLSYNPSQRKLNLLAPWGYEKCDQEKRKERLNAWKMQIKPQLDKLDLGWVLEQVQDAQVQIELENLYSINIQNLYSGPKRGIKSFQEFPFYKLHGSTNWYWSGLQEIADEKIGFLAPGHKKYLENLEQLKGLTQGFTPMIIPPLLDKNSFYNNHSLRTQWIKAFEDLSDLDVTEIYFVGYSLPPTDAVVRYFFSKSVSSRKELMIYIINLFEDEEYVDRDDLLRNYLLVFTSLSPQEINREIHDKEKRKKMNADKIFEINGIKFDFNCSVFTKENGETSTTKKLVKHLIDNLE